MATAYRTIRQPDGYLDPAPEREMLELDRDQCVWALDTADVGRVVAMLPSGAPVIRPVNYFFDVPSQSIIFHTGLGTKLYALLQSTKAWFEVDGIDADEQGGWSVIVEGVSEEVTSAGELARLRASGPMPWAPGTKHRCFRIRAVTVTGRRIIHASDWR
jgi:nitroimidazol reductase NimA-like FMN-containing flavoprotein (pyridoxamine 5'-phosphate oxidase superfamily)